MPNKYLCVIPARGGSVGVPRKNLLKINGKSLVKTAIDVARASDVFSQLVLTSDSDEILCEADDGISKIKRPANLASSESPVTDAIKHVLSVVGIEWDGIALLQPTSPLRIAEDIAGAFQLFENAQRSVCSVTRVEDLHPARMYEMDATSKALVSVWPHEQSLRRQDLTPVFVRNGAIYVFSVADALKGEIIGNNMVAYEMPWERSINIDTEQDYKFLKWSSEQY